MGWYLLGLAILFEVAGTTSMKLADGFTRALPSILVFAFYGASFVALVFVLKRIDLGIAYAVWSGVGMALVALIGAIWFGETVTVLKVVSFALIVTGVVGLNLADGIR